MAPRDSNPELLTRHQRTSWLGDGLRYLAPLSGKWLEIFCGLLMVFAGLWAGLQDGIQPRGAIIGLALTTVGGILLSAAISSVRTHEQAIEMLHPQLSALCERVGTMTGQMRQVVDDVHRGDKDESTGFVIVEHLTWTLMGVLRELQVLTRSQSDFSGLSSTVKAIRDLASGILVGDDEEVPEERKEQIAALVDQVDRLGAQLPGSPWGSLTPPLGSEVKVSCPECKKLSSQMLGDAGGSTRHCVCDSCGARFQVHRRSDGTYFVRGSTTGVGATPLAGSSLASTGYSEPAIEEYARVLRKQNIRLVEPEWRRRALQLLDDAFRVAPDSRFPDFVSMEDAIAMALVREQRPADRTEVRKLRFMVYKSGRLRLLGPAGIMLSPGKAGESLDESVCRMLVERLVSELDGVPKTELLARTLFGSADPAAIKKAGDLLLETAHSGNVAP